jgi:twitching motility protein PilU
VTQGASDLFLSSGVPASLKIQGQVKRLPESNLDSSQVQSLA